MKKRILIIVTDTIKLIVRWGYSIDLFEGWGDEQSFPGR